MPKPLISVVVPTRHRNDLLGRCLERLSPGRQTIGVGEYEVVVTDDGSSGTAETLIREQFPWAKWVRGPCSGPAANRNHGASFARGTWLAFTDDDCLPDPVWLQAYADAITAEPTARVFEGRTYVDRPRRSLAEFSPVNETGGVLWSCNFLIATKTFREVDGFDVRFRHAAMEDVDLYHRLRSHDHRISFVRNAAVCHPWRVKDGWAELQRQREAILLYLRLHPVEASHINARYYLRAVARGLLVTLPKAIRYRGRGLWVELLQQLGWLQMAWILLRLRRTPVEATTDQ